MVQLHHGQARGIGQRARPLVKLEQPEPSQHALDLKAPIIEVARHDQRRVLGHLALDETLDLRNLADAAVVNQPQVHDDGVHALSLKIDLHMQQAALLEAMV
ncbi:hypothetical protein SDC9_108715 [bioreactor metagenome]|uniref:Uncharacterized protein n=1 Tax=bioreactor metagenome TaxID=1076179 RepID=A0A645B8V8_9ZZZZ